MYTTEYQKRDGTVIKFPKGFKLRIAEISNNVYQIDLYDAHMRSVSNYGTDLDEMIESAVEDLLQMTNTPERMTIKVFNYIEALDCFLVTQEFKDICDQLGLRGWEQTAWLGRYFLLDNDYGEHWFDNWSLRDERDAKAAALGIDYDSMLIIDPDRFRNDADRPCHSADERKFFWTSVLKSLTLEFDVIVTEARRNMKQIDPADESYVADLEERIAHLKHRYSSGS